MNKDGFFGVQKLCKQKRFKSWGVIKLMAEIWGLKKIDKSLVQDKVKEIISSFKDILKELKGKEQETVLLRIYEYLKDGGRRSAP